MATACAYGRRWTWLLAAGGALLGGPPLAWAVASAAGLALAFASQFDRRRRQQVGALVGVLAALALLRLPPVVAFGVPSLLAFLAPLPAVVTAVAALRSTSRRPVVVATGVASGALVLVVVAFGIGLLLVRSDARTGVSRARAGLEQLRTGDEVAAADHFAEAASAFDRAHDVAGAWWMSPARFVPVLSQHLHATDVVTAEGRRLAAVSAATAPAVSLDELTAADGRFRVDRITELWPLAGRIVATLETSQAEIDGISTDWLTHPMAVAVDELRVEIAASLPDARTAVQALGLAPGLLGATEPQTYVVLLGNPAEARELGGFVANVGLLTADRGRLRFESLDPPSTLESRLRTTALPAPPGLPTEYAAAQPQFFVRNWTDAPDIQTIATTVEALLPAFTGIDVDGVLYLDPYVVAALLELTGPVVVPGTDDELTSRNAVDHLLRDQYLAEDFEATDADRKDRLGAAGELAFDRLTSGGLPGPRRLADLLAPLVHGRRLAFTTTDPAAHPLLDRVGLRPPVDTGGGETVLVTHGNRRANKLDAYLERVITHEAEIAPDGTTAATITVELLNRAPRRGLAEYQLGRPQPGDDVPRSTNELVLGVYSSLALTDVRIDGAPAPSSQSDAYGLRHHAVPVSVAAGRRVVVEIRLAGRLDPDECRFSFLPNASANEDVISSTVETPHRRLVISRRVLDDVEIISCTS